jgi:hypothetical protein
MPERFEAVSCESPTIPVFGSAIPNGTPAATKFPMELKRRRLVSKPPVAYDVVVTVRSLLDGRFSVSSNATPWSGSVPEIVPGNEPEYV